MKGKAEKTPEVIWQPEPRWHAILAIAAVACIYIALPSDLIIEPRWLFPAVVAALLVPTIIAHRADMHLMNHIFGFSLTSVLTLGMIYSVVQLILTLTDMKKVDPVHLLLSAGLLWFTNVIVFALWYWRLDAGGPHKREKRIGHPDGAFLFPQMTLPEAEQENWSPNFIDYLFIAFNTSTAFSPTDAPVLDRWAKFLMMVQSIISLTVIALLAARAINTLT